MLTISIQKAINPSYVTISATPFHWGVANRLTKNAAHHLAESRLDSRVFFIGGSAPS